MPPPQPDMNRPQGEREQSADDRILKGPDSVLYVNSNRQPDEVFQFGLFPRHEDIVQPQNPIHYVKPEELSIIHPRQDGLCIYCQLLLHPDAPQHAAHYPSLQLLLDSEGCTLCTAIKASLFQGCPKLGELYNAGYEPLQNRENYEVGITVECTRFEKHFRLVATCGDPGTSKFRGKPLVWTTNQLLGHLKARRIWENYYSPHRSTPISRLNVLKEWLADCITNHPHCERISAKDAPRLPTRVLEISGGDHISPFKIKLHTSNGERAHYIALSHCWGPPSSRPTLKTLKANMKEHEEQIPYDRLSLTFQDAVFYSAHMNYRYLWIDSLCIIQDDSGDWEQEAASMATVYSNATLTLAATAAPDGSKGCQFQCNGPICVPLDNDTAFIRFEDHLQLDEMRAPLNTRGWTFQESTLSRRMVCFPEDQMLWKCSTKHESEDGLLNNFSVSNGGIWNVWAHLQQMDGENRSYQFWYTMMEQYSRRQLTFDNDKLAALAGIIDEFKAHLKDDPVLGLWRGDMLKGLLWRTEEATNRIECTGVLPSWSWASVRGPVNWSQGFGIDTRIYAKGQLEVVSIDISWSGRSMTSQLLEAKLNVRSRLKRARLSKGPTEAVNAFHLCEIDDETAGLSASSKVEPPETLGYCFLEKPQPLNSFVWCLEVCSFSWRQEPDIPRDSGHKVLILVPTDAKLDEFTRVGVGNLWRQSFRADGETGTAVKETLEDIQIRNVSIV